MKKYAMEVIIAHNGVEVISVKDTSYAYTECDKVMAAWREQEYKSNKTGKAKRMFGLGIKKSA